MKVSPDMKKFYGLGKKEEPEVNEGELPKKIGQCWNCGYGSWEMRMVNHLIIRKCLKCGEDQEPV